MDQNTLPYRPRGEALLDEITAYLLEHLAERVTLRDIAAHFGVSVSTVTQLFQRKAETTLHQYLTELRMNWAEQLIRQGIPLEEVGKRVGYQDHSTFYRAFRRRFSVSPRQYRVCVNKTAENR